MLRRSFVHVLVVAAVVAGSLVASTASGSRRLPADGNERSSILAAVVSPSPLLAPRLKGGVQSWECGDTPGERPAALRVVPPALSSPFAGDPPSLRRFLCRAPSAARPPPQI